MTYIREYLLRNDPESGESTGPRRIAQTSVASGNGSLRLTYFMARKSETITQVRTVVGGTASVGATLARIGVYSVDGSNNLTLVGSTANDTSLWVAANTAYTKSFSASFAKAQGTRYAIGLLVVGTSTAPTFAGFAPPAGEVTQAPALGGLLGSQTDLPASISAGSISGTGQNSYIVLLP